MVRSYDETSTHLKLHYRLMRTKQTLSHVKRMYIKHHPDNNNLQMTIWEALDQLKDFIDTSDPDVTIANFAHAFQTAEGIREAGLPEWLQVTGLIHDIGKVMYLRGCDEDGTSIRKQWSIAGDIYVIGHPLPECLVLPEYNAYAPKEMVDYSRNCGFDQCYMSYGHDEYLYNVLVANREKVRLPLEALYIIRYHSFYAWHSNDAYTELESQYDRSMKGWVKLFNQYDLYTKESINFSEDEISKMCIYYGKLVDKYLPGKLNW